ncbi:hypothetical protein E2C01_042161 [Portunus trituberculatus]|uniref:Uncharacterized protein n=1 Tax=Portunus trituberculatus TaxID=210409 RepID=A0A5B7FL17_PORTR|nr:hypothetical protein [Portunus trituberculatus]
MGSNPGHGQRLGRESTLGNDSLMPTPKSSVKGFAPYTLRRNGEQFCSGKIEDTSACLFRPTEGHLTGTAADRLTSSRQHPVQAELRVYRLYGYFIDGLRLKATSLSTALDSLLKTCLPHQTLAGAAPRKKSGPFRRNL